MDDQQVLLYVNNANLNYGPLGKAGVPNSGRSKAQVERFFQCTLE